MTAHDDDSDDSGGHRSTVLRYGAHPSQVVHATPGAHSGAPLAVLVHGGWWRDIHGAGLMDPIAADLGAAGWAVCGIEYRRTGAERGIWRQTLDDAARALALSVAGPTGDAADGPAGNRAADPGGAAGRRRVVLIGHSVGAQLALLAMRDSGIDAAGAVLLAPVTDLRASAEQGLGEGAVADFLGADPAAELYRHTSPLHRLPFGVAQLVVHGDADQRVPVEQSRAYVRAARAAGDPVDFAEVPGLDHFAIIDPAHPSWRTVRAWIGADTGVDTGADLRE
ncbi:prolyl oligopeptidase family protein [Murinocardiopsis flavida]|uniref:Prolyl oligopeptidase family protein n=1 Tax=Murinocardiopsis flavida TaxID=645275 RepID=A0A2P8DSS9_9ACTN|nr:prolyl oligopeptidase family serine peptidase [Murinocardiopsis flavida]PSL00267.1 prolyl oligopeptidase family protein [Murinocardiopsis flavida]